MTKGYAVLVLFLMAGAATAQTAPDARPALIPTVSVTQNDSDLVRAAKAAVANRRGSKTAVVIDESYMIRVLGGPLSPGTAPHELAVREPKSVAKQVNAVNTTKSGPDPAKVEKRIQDLKQEQARMAAEMDEPYGGDVNEDRAAQRMSQIPQEIQEQQNSIKPPQ